MGDENDFADLGGVPADGPEDFADLGGVPAADPRETRPAGMVETGRRRTVLELPERTGLEAPSEIAARGATQVEEREVRPMDALESGLERVAQTPLGALGRWATGLFGLEPVTGESVARARAGVQRGATPGEAALGLVGTAPRSPEMSASESDRRTQAGLLGLGEGSTFGFLDEISGAARALPEVAASAPDPVQALGVPGWLISALRRPEYQEGREEARRTLGEASAQAPGASLVGQAAPALLMGLAGGPTASTALGRVGQGAAVGGALGALSGAGQAEEVGDVPGGAAAGGVLGGALGGGLQALGEVPGAVLGALGRARPRFGSRATQAGLEARGVWGGRAMAAADDLPGGREGLLANLERLGIGTGGAERTRLIPRPDQALDDLASVARRVSGEYDDVTRAIAEAGDPAVDVQPIARDMMAEAQRLERNPIGGERLYRSITENVVDPLTRPRTLSTGEVLDPSQGMPWSQAAQQRTVLRQLAGMGRQGVDPSLTATSDQLEAARRAMRPRMLEALRESPDLAQRFEQVDRDYAILRDLEEIGGGASRLSTQGGIGGAAAQAIENTVGSVPIVGGFIQRQLAQEQRMLMPGIQAALMRRLAQGSPALQRAAQVLQQALARSPQAAAATHYLLSQQNPEYRQAAEAAQEEESQ